MAYTEEEENRVDKMIAQIEGQIQAICEERRNTKGKKKKEALGMVVIALHETIQKVKEVWDLELKLESEWKEKSLATGLEYAWKGFRNRRNDIQIQGSLSWEQTFPRTT